jgi:hypothetical protein
VISCFQAFAFKCSNLYRRYNKEPELLKADGERVRRSMADVAVGQYRAFVGAAVGGGCTKLNPVCLLLALSLPLSLSPSLSLPLPPSLSSSSSSS